MADLPPNPSSQPNTRDESRLRRDRQSLPGLPRWVKVSAIIAVLLVLAFVAVHLAGGGFRGHAPLIYNMAPLP
jgi:hypothetical protein